MKTILAATDFTKSSVNAVRYAANLARETGSKLTVLHATHIPMVSDAYFDMQITLDELQEEDSKSLQKVVSDLTMEFGPDLKINKKLQVGFTTEVIRETIQEGDVSLVVMGIAHADAFSEAVFGSTSTSLAGTVSCPVLIIPENVKYRPWNHVTFAFDQKNIPTGTGVRVIKDLVKFFDAKLRFVHVNDNLFTDNDEKVLQPLYKLFKDADMKTYFISGKPTLTVDLLTDWVRRHKSTALVMVARKHNIFWKMFNERVTRKVAFHSKVPVLILSEKKNH
jgi:nucleotide-binding universal stress UspA family protein